MRLLACIFSGPVIQGVDRDLFEITTVCAPGAFSAPCSDAVLSVTLKPPRQWSASTTPFTTGHAAAVEFAKDAWASAWCGRNEAGADVLTSLDAAATT